MRYTRHAAALAMGLTIGLTAGCSTELEALPPDGGATQDGPAVGADAAVDQASRRDAPGVGDLGRPDLGGRDLGQGPDICVRPPDGCFSSNDCKDPNAVCTVELGQCDGDPCCPQCAVCYGTCVAQLELVVHIIDAEVWANLMPGPGTDTDPNRAVVKIELDNSNSSVDATSVKPIAAAIIDASGSGHPPYALDLQPLARTGTVFGGTVKAGQKLAVDYSHAGPPASTATQAFPCNHKVQVRVTVAHDGGKVGPVVSKVLPFGCAPY